MQLLLFVFLVLCRLGTAQCVPPACSHAGEQVWRTPVDASSRWAPHADHLPTPSSHPDRRR